MKKIILFLFTTMFLSSCGMTNDEIIIEKNKCINANMNYEVSIRTIDSSVNRVFCY